MAFRISLTNEAKKKVQFGSKPVLGADDTSSDEETGRKRLPAKFLEGHGDDDTEPTATGGKTSSGPTGPPAAHVPQGPKRHFAGRPRSTQSGPGTLPSDGALGYLGQTQFSQATQDTVKPVEVPKVVVAKASNLPPDTSHSAVKAIFADFPALRIVKIENIPPSGPAPKIGAAVSMKITFDDKVVFSELDTAVKALNDKVYLGRGFYLHLDRYLGTYPGAREQMKEPFGADWKEVEGPKGFAPTEDLGGTAGRTQARYVDRPVQRLVVNVQQPTNLRVLKDIHQTIDGVLRGGMEFEAALMNDPRIMTQERFAWLYDQTHPDNHYYRYKLHQMACPDGPKEIFRGCGEWECEDRPLSDEFATSAAHLDPDDDAMDIVEDQDSSTTHLKVKTEVFAVRQRAMLMFLLSSVPAAGTAMVYEVASVAAFAVDNAKEGTDEIVQILISNIFTPFNILKMNQFSRADLRDATLNALRIVSDVAENSHRHQRHAYKIRERVGVQLLKRGVFEYLEAMPARLDLGLFGTNEFREHVNHVLSFWSERILFNPQDLATFDRVFNQGARDRVKRKQQEKAQQTAKARKAAKEKAKNGEEEIDEEQNDEEIDENMGKNVSDDDDAQSTNVDSGEDENEIKSSTVTNIEDQQVENTTQEAEAESQSTPLSETPAARARRTRPKAEDFLDKD